MMLLEDDYK